MKTRFTDLFLYRWRYRLGYIVITLLIGLVIGIVASSIPGGLRSQEMNSAIMSGTLSIKSLDPTMVINWPYHMLQRGSFLVFGVTQLSIKLPSLVIGVLTAVGIFLLVRAWFRRNIAIVVTIIAVSMPPFLFMIQDGTPTIMFSALTIWLLVAGTFVTRGKRLFGTFWKVIGCVLLAMSLYIPLGVYVTLALIITASFHPHIRYVIRKIAKLRLILSLVLGLIVLTPLFYAIYVQPSVAATLLGVPTKSVDLGANLITVGQNLFGFFASSNSYLLRPVFSLSITLLTIIGIYRLLTVKYTARSYSALILGVIISVIVIINPKYILNLFPLVILMISMGMATLIIDWYKLFPRNPYARFAGLIPLGVLVAGMTFAGLSQYTNNYLYNPNILASYSFDLKILTNTLDSQSSGGSVIQLVTSTAQQPFYGLVAHYDKRLTIATSFDSPLPRVLVTRDAHKSEGTPENFELIQIITNKKSADANRFYLYKTPAK